MNGNQVKCGWRPSEDGVFKVNCDAVSDNSSGRIGIGVVIRDSKSEVFASCSQILMANLNTKASKLVAISKSIQFVLDCGLEPCCFEIDEALIVKSIKVGTHRSSVNGVLLDDIFFLSSKLRTMNISYAPKSANKVAQGLARHAMKIDEDGFWMEDFPSVSKCWLKLTCLF
ncbi:hypothetical protein Dsin_027378 [Dipteronia sinensis]|uniref:RNase H type-1 domain-containing protein n=1 Tax=Dipteronia sinensis TaxID=43782 RepID=A0AAD9ZNV8_9ROSI|nr:hypothetical protein Dsin_027378 [Dipteronia sinensis]